MANLGFYLVYLCFGLSLYGVIAAFLAAASAHRRLYWSSRVSLSCATVLTYVAASFLVYSFLTHDYSLAYVAKNSSNDMPLVYLITAFWSSLEGSHFFWTTIMSTTASIAIWTYAKDNEHIMPYCLGVFHAVLAWMYYLLMTHSDPFVVALPAPPNGNGMNELLQNIYMAIHPPLLFVGYSATVVPFAYAIAALFYGDVTEGWLRAVRRWTLVSFCFLTASIALGGKWAYLELGWAGYWAWDPVENSSFLPWLFSTCLLHTLLVQEKLGQLKRLSLIIAIASFFMTFFGTFITRSGVISSVHAFGEGPIGPNYLAFLAVLAVLSIILYGIRAPSILPADTQKVWGVSKESAVVLMQFLLLSFAAIVFIGTVFPIVSEALTDQRISVQAPYFNIFAPYVGLLMIMLIGIGNLMRFQSNKVPHLRPIATVAVVASFPLTLLGCFLLDIQADFQSHRFYPQVVGLYFVFFSGLILLGDAYLRLKSLKMKVGLFFKRNVAYFGALVAHLGFLLIIVGFLGNYRNLEKRVTLNSFETASLYGFDFQFQEQINVRKVENVTHYEAPIHVTRNGKPIYTLLPSQGLYPTKPGQPFNEVAVRGNFWHDIYIVLADFDRETGKQVTLSIHINPTVRIVWLAVVVIVIGGFISLFDKYRGWRSRDVVASSWQLQEERS